MAETASTITPPLEYARSSVVGAVSIDRRPDALIVTIRRSTPALFRGVVWIALGAIGCAGTVIAFAPVQSRSGQIAAPWWILFALTALGWIISGAMLIVSSLHPRTIQLNATHLSLTSRSEQQLSRVQWPRVLAYEILTSQPPRGLLQRLVPSRVVLVLLQGDRIELAQASLAESNFIRDELTAALGLPTFARVEVGFPKLRWYSRLRIRIDPHGILVHQPARGTWMLLIITFLLIPVSIYIAAVVQQGWSPKLHRIWRDEPGPLTAGCSVLFAGLTTCAIVYHLRRSAVFGIEPGLAVISERSAIRPAIEQWPTDAIAGFSIYHEGMTRWALRVEFVDRSSAPVLRALWQRDARVLLECVNFALARAKGQAAVSREGSS